MPLLPDTPLAPLIRKQSAARRAQALVDAEAGIARASNSAALSADQKQNSSGVRVSSHVVDIEAVAPPLPTANVNVNVKMLIRLTPGPLRASNGSIRPRTPRVASNISVWLAALQALLGVFVTQTMLIWQLYGLDNCSVPTISFIVCFTVGITCILFASAHQIYVIDGKFSKAFIAAVLGIAFNFIPLIVFAACAQVGLADQQNLHLCFTRFTPTVEWAKYLPLASSALTLLVCAAMSFSFLRAAYMLCLESACFLPREILLIMIHYRGIGLLFASVSVGALLSATIIVLAAAGYFDMGICWLAQWAIMSRMLTTSLWYRTHTDSVAHGHKFWKSFAFFWGYLRYHPDIEGISESSMV
ncbi:hypothetical protein IWW47_000024 [Coemansia sp. RSA 2052]|nr:hypothetical protein IWW47_000024 [Coemansia sp. RSA 2052]